MRTLERSAVVALTALWLLPGGLVSAQEEGARIETPASDQAPAGGSSAQKLFPEDRIRQLVAPIALYPDALLALVLMASTYPLDIVQAARWQEAHPDLKDEALDAAVAEESWDQSVKTLLFFPDVLAYMNKNLDWTQDLGDAVLGQEEDVANAVQDLRREAYAAGNLKSTEQQRVEVQQPMEADFAPQSQEASGTQPSGDLVERAGGDTIVIQPANAEVVYVPSYNPSTVYGQTEPPATNDYPAAYTTPTTTYVSDTGSSGSDSLVNFGVGALAGGLLTAAIMWDDDDDRIYYGGPGYYGGGGYWNRPGYWEGGYRRPESIHIDRDLNIDRGDVNISRDRGDINVNREVKKWQHNPERRGGVRYRNQETQKKYARAGQDRVGLDTVRGRDPDRKRAQPGRVDRPQIGGGDRPKAGEIKRPGRGDAKGPATREAKRPEAREVKRPDKGTPKRPETRDVKRPEAPKPRDVQRPQAPQKRDVQRPAASKASVPQRREVPISKPKAAAKKPAARTAARPTGATASRHVKPSGGKSSAFQAQRGSQTRAAANRGAASRGGGARRGGGGGRGGGRRRG